MKRKILVFSSTIALAFGAISATADEVESSGTPGVTLYSFPNYSGRRVVLNRDTPKLKKLGFAANSMSMKVAGGKWEVCDSNRYSGTCEVFGPGNYTFGLFNWGNKIKSVRRLRTGTPTITLFKKENMQGEHNTYASSVPRLKDFSSNSVINSAKVNGGEWVLCENSAGKGNCETLRRDVSNLRSIGLKNTILSLYRASEWNNGLDGGSYGGGGYTGGGGGYGGYGPGERRYGGGGGGRRYSDAYPQIVLFEGYGFSGPRITIDSEAADLRNSGFSNRASSVRVTAGAWELCDGAGYTKTCRVVTRDESNLGSIDLDMLITSLRPVSDGSGGRDRRATNTRGFEGQRTVFFAEPSYRGEPVASCLYGNSQCGIAAANAFCQKSDLGSAVYFDQARSYRAPYVLGDRRTATRPGQQRLIDVLCRR